jgi:nicotinamide-nucleotide amidase
VGGVVSYANEAKVEMLGVAPELIEAHGAVSEEVARAMAEGALGRFGCDIAVAVTGVAGPDGGTPDKPVGTVWIAVASRDGVTARRYTLGNDRPTVRERASNIALDMVRRAAIAILA